MTPIGLADEIRQFGTIYGQVVATKSQAVKYPALYATWQDLIRRGEQLRQVAAKVAGMGNVAGQLETLISGVFGSLIPASLLPEGINQVNLYAISGWESDAKAYMLQLRQVQQLEQSGVSQSEISNAIQPTGLISSVSSAGSSALGLVEKIALGAAVLGLAYIYFVGVKRK